MGARKSCLHFDSVCIYNICVPNSKLLKSVNVNTCTNTEYLNFKIYRKGTYKIMQPAISCILEEDMLCVGMESWQ